MPKKSLKIDKFEGGLVSHYNARDIPDNSFVEAQDVMVDIIGKVRLMGEYKTFVHGANPLDDLPAQCNPGHGLYAFSADYDISGASNEVDIIAIQKLGSIGLFDGLLVPSSIVMTADDTAEMGPKCEPVFFYTNGALRVSDGYIENVVAADGSQGHDGIDNRWFGYINRTLFSGLGTTIDRVLGWTDELQEIVTPTVNAQNALLDVTPDAGTISIKPTWVADSEEGEWNASQLDSLTFGYSWLYDDEKQESKVALFEDDIDVTSSVDYALELQVFIDNTGFSSIPNRVTGFRIYWMGEGGDLFEDPFQLAEGDFVKGTLTGHNNTVVDFSVSGDYYVTPAAGASPLTLPTQPALTFRLINGYKHDIDSITARYKTAVIANGVSYIGNIRQNGRNYHDRMIKSAIGPDGKGFFDVFPSDNFLDVAVADGDAITALEEFSDRLLQFKKKSLYVINISGDFEYVEGHHRFMGVSSQNAVTRLADGIAWVNKNGCYIFNGEGIINVLNNKINPSVWKQFIGNDGVIGYIGPRQQIIVTGTSNASEAAQDIYMYDIRTASWTLGKGKLPRYARSNFISNYKDTLLFASIKPVTDQSIDIRPVANVVPITNGRWHIPNINGFIFNNTDIRINGFPITGNFSVGGEGDLMTAQEKIANEISTGPYSTALTCNALGNPDPLVVTMEGHYNDDTDDDLSGGTSAMTFSNPPFVTSDPFTFVSGLGQTLTTCADMSIIAETDYGFMPAFQDFGQEVVISVGWNPPASEYISGGYHPNIGSHRSGFYQPNASAFYLAGRAAQDIGYETVDDDGLVTGGYHIGKIDPITMSGLTDIGTGTSGASNIALSNLNNTRFHPYIYNTNGDKIYDFYDAVNADASYRHAIHIGNIRVMVRGVIFEDIGLLQGQHANMTGQSLVMSINNLRVWSVVKDGFTYLAMSFPRQVGGDINALFGGSYQDYIDAVHRLRIIGTEFTVSIDTDSVLNGKVFEVVDHVDLEDQASSSMWYPQSDAFVGNGSGYFNVHLSILKIKNGTDPDALLVSPETHSMDYTTLNIEVSVDVPVTDSIPDEGVGAKKIVIPKRNAAVNSDVKYNLEIVSSASNEGSVSIQYTTNADDNPLEIITGFDSVISGYIDNSDAMSTPFVLASSTKVEKLNLSISIVNTGGVFSLQGAGLIAAGFTDDMEVELLASTGSGHSNDGARFLISEVTGGGTDILKINALANTPYIGLSLPVAQGSKSYNVQGGALIIQDSKPQPNITNEFSIGSSIDSGQVVFHEFANNSSEDGSGLSNTSSAVRLLTKEFDFGDLAKKKSISNLYITHNNHSQMSVNYIVNGNISNEVLPINVLSDDLTIQTLEYPIKTSGIRTFQVSITSKEPSSDYILNDITIVYRERSAR